MERRPIFWSHPEHLLCSQLVRWTCQCPHKESIHSHHNRQLENLAGKWKEVKQSKKERSTLESVSLAWNHKKPVTNHWIVSTINDNYVLPVYHQVGREGGGEREAGREGIAWLYRVDLFKRHTILVYHLLKWTETNNLKCCNNSTVILEFCVSIQVDVLDDFSQLSQVRTSTSFPPTCILQDKRKTNIGYES